MYTRGETRNISHLFSFNYTCNISFNKQDFRIIWLSNILALSVPDEGYSGNVSCALNLLSAFLFLIDRLKIGT